MIRSPNHSSNIKTDFRYTSSRSLSPPSMAKYNNMKSETRNSVKHQVLQPFFQKLDNSVQSASSVNLSMIQMKNNDMQSISEANKEIIQNMHTSELKESQILTQQDFKKKTTNLNQDLMQKIKSLCEELEKSNKMNKILLNENQQLKKQLEQQNTKNFMINESSASQISEQIEIMSLKDRIHFLESQFNELKNTAHTGVNNTQNNTTINISNNSLNFSKSNQNISSSPFQKQNMHQNESKTPKKVAKINLNDKNLIMSSIDKNDKVLKIIEQNQQNSIDQEKYQNIKQIYEECSKNRLRINDKENYNVVSPNKIYSKFGAQQSLVVNESYDSQLSQVQKLIKNTNNECQTYLENSQKKQQQITRVNAHEFRLTNIYNKSRSLKREIMK